MFFGDVILIGIEWWNNWCQILASVSQRWNIDDCTHNDNMTVNIIYFIDISFLI